MNFSISTSTVGNPLVVKLPQDILLSLKIFLQTLSTGYAITRQVRKSAYSQFKMGSNASGKIKSAFLFLISLLLSIKIANLGYS